MRKSLSRYTKILCPPFFSATTLYLPASRHWTKLSFKHVWSMAFTKPPLFQSITFGIGLLLLMLSGATSATLGRAVQFLTKGEGCNYPPHSRDFPGANVPRVKVLCMLAFSQLASNIVKTFLQCLIISFTLFCKKRNRNSLCIPKLANWNRSSICQIGSICNLIINKQTNKAIVRYIYFYFIYLILK